MIQVKLVIQPLNGEYDLLFIATRRTQPQTKERFKYLPFFHNRI